MLRKTLLILALCACPSLAQAEYPGHVYGGWYGAYGSYIAPSIRTPPYFAVRPPVYYGDQYARPYGLSPYPAPPLVQAPAGYEGRLMSSAASPVVCNPYVEREPAATAASNLVAKSGPIQKNPYAQGRERVARR